MAANGEAKHQTGGQRGGKVGDRENKARAEQQRRNAQADAGLNRPADIQNPHQRAFDNTREQEAGAERRYRAVGPGIDSRFQHRHESDFC